MKYLLLLTLFVILSLTIRAQCKEDELDCNCTYTTREIKICFAGTSYNAEIEMCTQTATTQLIDNPCAGYCARPVNSVTWVRRICVDQDLKNQGMLAIYNAIVAGTNLCCNNFIGATIPFCDPWTDCKTSTTAYCHLLMLPKCTTKNFVTGCYEYCDNGCNDYCVVERRYCMMNATTCCMNLIPHVAPPCEFASDDECNQGCTTPFDQCASLTSSSQTCCP
jgi:hypothetical protein